MKINWARREFIRQFGRNLGFMGLSSSLMGSVVSAFLQKAWSATTEQPSVNFSKNCYIHFSMLGGPPRWLFDLPLTPMGKTSANFIQGAFGTRLIKVGSNFKSVYEDQKFIVGGRSLYLPPVWGMGLSSHQFADLLPHCVFIRGVHMEINNHGLSNSRQVAPIIGGYSINGMMADRSLRPMPSIVDGSVLSGKAFRSKKGLSANEISYSESATVNPATKLLQPFQNFFTKRVVHSPSAKALSEQAFTEFEKYALQRGLTSSSLTTMYDHAMELVEQNIYNMASQWSSVVGKYRRIISEAMSPSKGSLPGIFDAKITSNSDASFKYDLSADAIVKLDDVRDMVTATIMIPRLAENFALAELLLDKVTSNMVLSVRPPTEFQDGKKSFTLQFDQHYVGHIVSTMLTTLVYRAFLGCLTEYVAVLKNQRIFDRTILHLSSEFNRTPRIDGAGSDHGFMGSNATLISGMIQQPAVIGNIQTASYNSTYQGTFGVAKNYLLEGFVRPIQVNDIALTITSMLGVDNDLVTNGRALLKLDGASWVPKLLEAKNV